MTLELQSNNAVDQGGTFSDSDGLTVAIDRETRAWFAAQCRDVFAHFHVYYLPYGGRVAIAEDAPGDDWALAHAQRVSPSFAVGDACTWVRHALRHQPVLRVTAPAVAR